MRPTPCEYVQHHADAPLDRLIEYAFRALSGTGGAAVGLLLVSTSENTLSLSGVGKISLQSASRSPIKPMSLPGIVSRQARKIRVFE